MKFANMLVIWLGTFTVYFILFVLRSFNSTIINFFPKNVLIVSFLTILTIISLLIYQFHRKVKYEIKTASRYYLILVSIMGGLILNYIFNFKHLMLFKGEFLSDIFDICFYLAFPLLIYVFIRYKYFIAYNNGEEQISKEVTGENPISSAEEDELGRNKFAQDISKVIRSNKNNSITLGLYGEWGSGKSSLLNLIEKDLQTDNDITVFRFNPWYLGENSDYIILNFFNQLSKTIREDSGFESELSTKIETYAKLLSSISFRFNGLVVNLKELFTPVKETSLDEAKKAIASLILDSKKSLLIIIDEIDRLEHDEVRNILKLVRFIGDFPNTTYLLSFDEKIVTEVISKNYENELQEGLEKKDFLGKFIQIPFYVPKVDQNKLKKMCEIRLNKVLIREQIIDFPYEKLQYHVETLNVSPRNVKRLIMLCEYFIPMLKNEVNEEDLILLLLIKLESPKLYEFIRNNPLLFTEKIKKENINVLTFNEFTKFENILLDLFPYSVQLFEGKLDNVKTIPADFNAEKRISSVNFFYQYFMYTVPENEVSQEFLSHFLNEINKYQTLEQDVDKYISNSYMYSPQKFNEAIKARVRFLDKNVQDTLLVTISKVYDYFYIEGEEEICNSLLNLMENIMKTLDNNLQTSSFFEYISINEPNFKLFSHLINYLEGINFIEQVVPDKLIEDVKEKVRDRIDEDFHSIFTKYHKKDRYQIYILWKELSSEENIKVTIEKILREGTQVEEIIELFYNPNLNSDNIMGNLEFYVEVISVVPQNVLENFIEKLKDNPLVQGSTEEFINAYKGIYDYIIYQLNEINLTASQQGTCHNLSPKFRKTIEKLINNNFTHEHYKERISDILKQIDDLDELFQKEVYKDPEELEI